jgi:hypothetical protein
MARTELSVQTLPTSYTAGMTGVENNLTLTAADDTNDNYMTPNGRSILLIAYNSGATDDLVVTIPGGTYNPIGTIDDSTITVDGSEYGFLVIEPAGYTQSDSTIHIDTTSSDIKLAAIQL